MERYDSYKESGVDWIGRIPSSWTIPKMSYLLEGITDGTHGTHERVNEGKLFLSSKNITNKGVFIGKNESHITTEEHEKIVKKGYPVKGDILITVVGSIGRSCVYEYDYPISFQRSVCFLRFKKKINEYFMNFLIHSDVIQFQLLKNTKKSTQGGIYMNDLKRFDIILPSLPEQQQIVSFLDNKTSLIDSLIEKTQRKIELLKEKRTSLINEVVTKGLNPNVKMRDSGVEWIGEIPSHWKKTKLKRYVSIFTGYSFKSDWFGEEGVPVIRISNIQDGFIDFTKSVYLTENFLTDYPDYVVKRDDTLICLTGSLTGKVGKFNHEVGLLNQRVGKIVVRGNKVLKGFIDKVFFFQRFQGLIKEMGEGISENFPNVSHLDVVELEIPLPPLSEQQQIVEYLDEQTQLIDSTTTIEEKRIELLKEYRQSLISEVVSGKRKVV